MKGWPPTTKTHLGKVVSAGTEMDGTMTKTILFIQSKHRLTDGHIILFFFSCLRSPDRFNRVATGSRSVRAVENQWTEKKRILLSIKLRVYFSFLEGGLSLGVWSVRGEKCFETC